MTHYIECTSYSPNAILGFPSLCQTGHWSPMATPIRSAKSYLYQDGPRHPRGQPRGQRKWHSKWRSDRPKDYGRPASLPWSLLSTDSSRQSYYTANTSLSSPTSTCSSNMSFPYTVTSIHSYKSNKNVLYPRRVHPPPVALASQVRLLLFVLLSQYKFFCRTTCAIPPSPRGV